GGAQRLQRGREGIAMRAAAAVRPIERRGERRALGEDLAAPSGQPTLLGVAVELQARLAAAQRDALLVAPHRGNLLRRVGRAVGEQAVQQEHVEQAAGRRPDADRAERIEVHQAYFDVLDAAAAQGVQRALARVDAAFGADAAVEFVLDLQQAGRELAVVVVVADADLRVGRIGLGERLVERRRIALEVVIAHVQRGLRVALVAERPHAQRRRMRRVHGAGRELDQLVFAALDKARAHRGRGAEQVDRQPRVAPEIADQREILRVGHAGERPVVVDAGDRLHAPAVAVREAEAVHGLRAADVRGAVAPDRDLVVRREVGRHARAPQDLLADVAVDDLVDPGELLQARVDAVVHSGDQLELRLAEVGGDVRVRERRAERRRVRRLRQRAVGTHAQALLLDAAAHSLESFRRESTQPILVKTHGFAKVTEFRLPNARRHRYTCRANRRYVYGEGRCK